MLTFDLSNSYPGFKTLIARSSIKNWFTMALSIIYESPWSSPVILIKKSSRVWNWFALETLVHLGILSNFFTKLLHQLIRYFKGYFKFHHLMHIWSTMSLQSQENCKLVSWLMVVGQINSSYQNWVSLDLISYKFHHIKMIPREKLLNMTLQKTFMFMSRANFACKVIFYVETL